MTQSAATPTKKPTTPFDFVRSITDSKTDIYNEDTAGAYSQYIINRALSFYPACVFYVHEIAKTPVDDRTHYLFLLNAIPKQRKYAAWVKKDSIGDDVALISGVYGYSTKEAMSVVDLLSDKQMLELKNYASKGGINK